MDARITRLRLVAAALGAASLGVAGAVAQVADVKHATSPASPPPDAAAPPPPATTPPAPAAEPEVADNQAEQDEPENKVVAPVVPPMPARAQAAVLRVLDKVTAETMAFEAPIGRRVRYKSLVFEVKTCVTRGAGDPLPQPSAYLSITSDAGASIDAGIGPRQVFRGWMFANAPGLNALKHPVYDAWLVACSTAAPAT